MILIAWVHFFALAVLSIRSIMRIGHIRPRSIYSPFEAWAYVFMWTMWALALYFYYIFKLYQ